MQNFRHSTQIFTGLLLASLLLPTARAETTLFRCTDQKGRVTYSDARCNERGNQGKESVLTILDAPTPPAVKKPPLNIAAKPVLSKEKPRFYNYGRTPTIPIYYDPEGAPPEYTLALVGEEIQRTARLWQSGCDVILEYKGTSPASLIKRNDGVTVVWQKEYQELAHPSHSKSNVGGTGSLQTGIRLRPRKDDEDKSAHYAQHFLQRLLTHEMGHVLGLAHNHNDLKSVMSYAFEPGTGVNVKPNEADYRDCNFAMEKVWGVRYSATRDEKIEHAKPRMTDREILERQLGPDPKK